LTRGQEEQIGSVLETLVARWGIKKPLKRAQVLNDWDEIVGPKIARETRADHIRNTILFVSCSSPVWAQELGMLKPQILPKIRAVVGPGIVTDIRFKTGQI
jgi:predicted nucleic acid-binding Zn ribbon protein